MIGWIWGAIKLFGIGKSLAFAGVGLALLATVYGIWHVRVYKSGWNAAIAAIAAQDQSAIADAQQKRSVFKACRAEGRKWDPTTGTCS